MQGDYETVLKLFYELEDYENCHETLVIKIGPALAHNQIMFQKHFPKHLDKMKEFKDKIKNWHYGGAILSGEIRKYFY